MKKSLKILFALSSISVLTACPANEAYKGLKVDYYTFCGFAESHLIKDKELMKLGQFSSTHVEEINSKIGENYSEYYYFSEKLEYDSSKDAFHFSTYEIEKDVDTVDATKNYEHTRKFEGYVYYSNTEGLIALIEDGDNPKAGYHIASNKEILDQTSSKVSFDEVKFTLAVDYIYSVALVNVIYGTTWRLSLNTSMNNAFYVSPLGRIEKMDTYINPNNNSVSFDVEITNIFDPEHFTNKNTECKVKHTGYTENGLMIDECKIEHETGVQIETDMTETPIVYDQVTTIKSNYSASFNVPSLENYIFA